MIRKKIFTRFVSYFMQFGVNIIGLPVEPIEMVRYANYKFINAKR